MYSYLQLPHLTPSHWVADSCQLHASLNASLRCTAAICDCFNNNGLLRRACGDHIEANAAASFCCWDLHTVQCVSVTHFATSQTQDGIAADSARPQLIHKPYEGCTKVKRGCWVCKAGYLSSVAVLMSPLLLAARMCLCLAALM